MICFTKKGSQKEQGKKKVLKMVLGIAAVAVVAVIIVVMMIANTNVKAMNSCIDAVLNELEEH